MYHGEKAKMGCPDGPEGGQTEKSISIPTGTMGKKISVVHAKTTRSLVQQHKLNNAKQGEQKEEGELNINHP